MKKFSIIGRKFSTEKRFYDWDKEKRFFYYDITEEKEFPAMDFESLDHAELWLMENFPEWWMGCNIVGVDNKDFSANCVADYWEMIYSTNDRKLIVEKEMERLKERCGC